MNNENLYTITEYGNGKAYMIKKIRNNNPFKNRTSVYKPVKRKRNFENPYMTIKQYSDTLSRKQKELYNYDIDPKKCLYITLTTLSKYDWVTINNKFNALKKSLMRNFRDTKYIRGIELFKSDKPHYHIHLLLIFSDSIPTNFNKAWLKRHWKGRSQIKPVNDYYAFVDYITLFDENAVKDKNDPIYTKFPQYVKIITNSTGIPKIDIKEYEYNQQGIDNLYKDFNDKHNLTQGKNCFVNTKKHFYTNQITGEVIQVIDREFWH